MNHLQFSVSAEAFRKGLEKESKTDRSEEAGEPVVRIAKKRPSSSFWGFLALWDKSKRSIEPQVSLVNLKNKTV